MEERLDRIDKPSYQEQFGKHGCACSYAARTMHMQNKRFIIAYPTDIIQVKYRGKFRYHG
jgi:hypothetical protein